MNDFFQFIWENKHWIFSGIGVAIITIYMSKRKKKQNKKDDSIIIKIDNRSNNTNNAQNDTRNNNNRTYNKKQVKKSSDVTYKVQLERIRLYSTGIKGKVYTSKFFKSINHNFGIEILLKNNTASLQNVKVGWCIYDDVGTTIIKGTFNKKVNPNSTSSHDFYVKEKAFINMKPGEYKSQFWVNDQKVQREFFTIAYK